jgi:hypothetical protein
MLNAKDFLVFLLLKGEPTGWCLIVGALFIFSSGIGLNLLPDK